VAVNEGFSPASEPSPPRPKRVPPHRRPSLVAAMVVLFALVTVGLTRPPAVASSSAVTGLMALKATAQMGQPYDQAMASGKPTLVEFYADWCTTCQAMAPTLVALHQRFGEAVDLVMVDIDDPQGSDLVARYGVSGVPHLVLAAADGTVAQTWVGEVPYPVLASQLSQTMAPSPT